MNSKQSIFSYNYYVCNRLRKWEICSFRCFKDIAGDLYFELGGVRYESGSVILITEVGRSSSNILHPGSSLVCVTSEVNMHCCRELDGGHIWQWHFPDGSLVPHNQYSHGEDFSSSGYTQQVRLNRRNDALGPSGIFTCVVPREDRCEDLVHTASIKLGQSSVCANTVELHVHIQMGSYLYVSSHV